MLLYYWSDGTREIFDKYTIDPTGLVRNKITGNILSQTTKKTAKKDGTIREDCCYMLRSNDGKRKGITTARAILSTFVGPPPTKEHTADHVNRNTRDNSLSNLRWASLTEQAVNRDVPETNNSTFVIVKDGDERTAKEWATELNRRPITILEYARKKKNGFSYKEYPDLPRETWKVVEGSRNGNGHWEVSDKKRAKYTNIAGNSKVYDDFHNQHGYPVIRINGKLMYLHRVILHTFFPEEYAKLDEQNVVRHLDDDRTNFLLDNLEVGTRSLNTKEAHDNGKYDKKKSARKPVASHLDSVLEREFESHKEAVRYLQENGYPKANHRGINLGIKNGRMRYDRTWKLM